MKGILDFMFVRKVSDLLDDTAFKLGDFLFVE